MNYALIGAGGFGKEVMPILKENYGFGEHIRFIDDRLAGDEILRCKVMSMAWALTWPYPLFFNVAIGSSALRQELAEKMIKVEHHPEAIISKRANVQEGCEVGRGAVICPFGTINASARVGQFLQLNIYAYIAHDCEVGDFVTLAPGAKVNGKCKVGDHAYIGTGAILLPGVEVGARATIGAGAVVTKNVPEGETWVGVPARAVSPRL